MKKIKVLEVTTVDKTKHKVRFVETTETLLAYLSKAEKNGQKWVEFFDDTTEKHFHLRVENITSIKLVDVK